MVFCKCTSEKMHAVFQLGRRADRLDYLQITTAAAEECEALRSDQNKVSD